MIRVILLCLVVATVFAKPMESINTKLADPAKDVAQKEARHDESNSLAEDPAGEAGEASSLAQLTQQRAAGVGTDGVCVGTDKYIELTTEFGTAHATNFYSNRFNAEKAFKIIGEWRDVYWATSRNPNLPVFIWFQFNNPKTVFNVKFLADRYALPTGKVYEVFASNPIDDSRYNCGNPQHQTILCNGTADQFENGKECANNQSYYCYGLKVSDHSTHAKKYIGVRKLQFLFEEMECADPGIAAEYCLHGGTCFEQTNGTLGCHCTATWTGERCIDRYIKPCEVRGSCTPERHTDTIDGALAEMVLFLADVYKFCNEPNGIAGIEIRNDAENARQAYKRNIQLVSHYSCVVKKQMDNLASFFEWVDQCYKEIAAENDCQKCREKPEWAKLHTEMECAEYCLNGGTCFELANGTLGCHCTAKWTGERCKDRYIKPCDFRGNCTSDRHTSEIDGELAEMGLYLADVYKFCNEPNSTAGIEIRNDAKYARQVYKGNIQLVNHHSSVVKEQMDNFASFFEWVDQCYKEIDAENDCQKCREKPEWAKFKGTCLDKSSRKKCGIFVEFPKFCDRFRDRKNDCARTCGTCADEE